MRKQYKSEQQQYELVFAWDLTVRGDMLSAGQPSTAFRPQFCKPSLLSLHTLSVGIQDTVHFPATMCNISGLAALPALGICGLKLAHKPGGQLVW